MTSKRFLRDIAVLLGFCLAFYLFIVLMGKFDPEGEADSDFSVVRKRADVALKRRDYPAASIDYRALAEKDPYNGPAWYRCANSLARQRNSLLNKIRELKLQPDSDVEVERLHVQVKEVSEKAREVYLRSKEFARFRADSLFMLASLDVYDGRYDQALVFLDEFVEKGHCSERGLHLYGHLGYGGPRCASPLAQASNTDNVRLHSLPKFWEIQRKETFNRTQ